MARPKSEKDKPLTDTEIQIMNVLWDSGGATVHEVMSRLLLTQGKEYAYTTVSTMLRVLQKKGVVLSRKEGRGHSYRASIERSNYQRKATDHLVNHVFEGECTALIRSLLGNATLNAEELKEIQNLLAEKANDE